MTLKGLFGGVAAALLLTLPAAAQGPMSPPTDSPTGHLETAPADGVDDAQYQGPPGRGPMMGRPGAGMQGHPGMRRHRGMWRAPLTMMLRHRDELGLSPAQVQSLDKLRGDYMREAIRRDADRKIAGLDLMSLMRPDPADPMKPVDMAKVESKVRELEKMRADSRLARIRTIEAGKAQLTPEQKTKFAALMAQMRTRWQHGGPPAQRPMMTPPAPRS